MTLGKQIDIGHYGAVDIGDGGAKESNTAAAAAAAEITKA